MRGHLSPKALALVSAALRHMRDAEHLADARAAHSSPDQAYHLAGFGPECARKATLTIRWSDKPLGHALDQGATDPVLEIALALDPYAQRYNPLDWSNRYPALARWNPQCRYDQTGKRDARQIEALVREARLVVDELVGALWADGRLPDTGIL
jgi:hypothetical protein